MSYTVILSVAPGRMIIDYASDTRTPAKAVESISAKHQIDKSQITDALVLLGITGSTVLHTSAGKAVPHKDPTQQELEDAFALVRPKDNWKNPINVIIPKPDDAMIALLTHAISYFTGSAAEFTPVGKRNVRVTAAGYYAAIGS